MKLKNQNKLTRRQLDVMKVLWESDKPLIASEIVKRDSSFNINTVQTALKVLLNQGYIDVADIVYSGTVLTRSYKPILSPDTYFESNFSDISIFKSPVSLFANFINSENDSEVIDKLEEIIRKRKEELKEGE